jgi:hypothetical protein
VEDSIAQVGILFVVGFVQPRQSVGVLAYRALNGIQSPTTMMNALGYTLLFNATKAEREIVVVSFDAVDQ